MLSVLGQQLWKDRLVPVVLTIVLDALVPACPGPSILLAATIFSVYLLARPYRSATSCTAARFG
jgi:hypothetical protein